VEYAALGLLGMVITAILVVILDSLFLHIGAKMAGVRRATFGTAVKASIACALSTLLLTLIFSWVPVAGTGIGFLAGLLLTILVLQASYSTSFPKAFLLWLFNVAAQIGAVFVSVFLLAGVFSITS